jgi:transcriptional regulator with XRE-family HTH domain
MEITANEKVKLYRRFLDLSQSELAAAMGTTQTSVARWESGDWTITPQTISHLAALVELRVKADIQKDFGRLVPELMMCDFEGLLGYPSSALTLDRNGRVYVGLVEIMGHREHSLHLGIADHDLYALDREGVAQKVDEKFLQRVRLKGRLRNGDASMKDDPAVQRERIRRIAALVVPGSEVVFDSSQPFTWIRFRLDEPRTGTILGTPSGHYHVSEIADWPDQKLAAYIGALNPSFAK